MCLKSEGIQFPSFGLLSFFSTWIQVRFFWVLFLLFFIRFRKSSCFFFFSLLSLLLFLFFSSSPHSKTQEITLLSPWYVPSLSFRGFSLSLFSRRRGKGVRVALESALFTAGRFSRARDERRFFLTRCGFSANFGRRKSPLSHEERVCDFKRKRRKSRESLLSRDLDSLETSLTLPFLSFQSRISRAVEPDERYPHPQAHPEHLRRGISDRLTKAAKVLEQLTGQQPVFLQSKIHRPYVRYSS